MKYKLECDWCHKPIEKWVLHEHNFCSRQCLGAFSSKKSNPEGYKALKAYEHIGEHFKELNPTMNKTRMTPEVRAKIRESRLGSGDGVTYTKLYGRHEHRVVAEQILGRPLKAGEIVHHRDGNKRNNNPENLIIFDSQSEHAKHHAEMNWFIKQLEHMEGGDAT